MTHAPHDLGDGVLQFQTPLWQTNSVLVGAGATALVCDAAFAPTEIERIRAESERAGPERTFFLLTHADFDHTCGVPAFPDAEVLAGGETAEKVASGAAAEELRATGPHWGLEWPTEGLRVDRTLADGEEVDCGGVPVVALDAPSHGREGFAFVLPEQGLLLAADHVSAITYPLLAEAPPRALAACERLLDALGRHPVRRVVPGHGPALDRDEAQRVAEADRSYLEGLEVAAREAVESDLAPGYALLHVYAAEPPRASTPDFEVYGIRAANAQLVLDDVRERLGAGP